MLFVQAFVKVCEKVSVLFCSVLLGGRWRVAQEMSHVEFTQELNIYIDFKKKKK